MLPIFVRFIFLLFFTLYIHCIEELGKTGRVRRRSRLNLTLGSTRFLFSLLIAILRLRSFSLGLSCLVVSLNIVGVTHCQPYIFPSLIWRQVHRVLGNRRVIYDIDTFAETKLTSQDEYLDDEFISKIFGLS